MAAEKQRRLTDDETGEILVRLPLKDLARCKLVCKDWRSLISSPGFVSAHLKHSSSDPSSHRIIIHDEIVRRVGAAPPGPFRSVICCWSEPVAIVGSINGLIFLAGNYRAGLSPDEIWILNSVTRHLSKLPPPTYPVDKININSDDCDRVTFAFWWDSITDVYKVVRISSHLGQWDEVSEAWDYNSSYPYPNTAEVWVSSSPDKWTPISIDFDSPFYHRPVRCDIIVGGFAYWIVVHSNHHVFLVLSLDMTTLVLKLISLSPRLMQLNIYKSLLFAVSWKGDFALVERNEAEDMHTVWMLENGAWINHLSFHLGFVMPRLLNFTNGKLVLMRDSGRITLYDLETQNYEDLEVSRVTVSSAHDFVGSFVSIKGLKHELNTSRFFVVTWPN